MACNISNTFSRISILLRAHGEDRTIFSERPQGRFSSDDWQLQVQGGQAQLVIAAVRDAHAGRYLWFLQGLQRNSVAMFLNVSGEAGPGRGQSRAEQEGGPGAGRGARCSREFPHWEGPRPKRRSRAEGGVQGLRLPRRPGS